MNILNVKVRNRNLRINEKDLVGNNVGFDQVKFDFSEEWEKLEKVAVFYLHEDELYPVLVTDNVADIPYQVLKNNQVLYFGLYGVSNNQKILSSKILKIEIAAGCPIKTAEDYEEYEDIHVQILAKLADIYDRIIYRNKTEEEIETNWEHGTYQAGGYIETIPTYTARDIPVKGKLVFSGCPEGWYHTDYRVTVILDARNFINLQNSNLQKEIEIPDKYNNISITVGTEDLELVNQFKFKWNIYSEETIKERIDKKADKKSLDDYVPKTRKVADIELTRDITGTDIVDSIQNLGQFAYAVYNAMIANTNNYYSNSKVLEAINENFYTIFEVDSKLKEKVDKTCTIAGLPLDDNIAALDLINALNLINNFVPKERTVAGLELSENIGTSDLAIALRLEELYATKEALSIVESIAKGATQAKSFQNYSRLIDDLKKDSDAKSLRYRIGQNFFIGTSNVPDVWVYYSYLSYGDYEYSTDEQFVSDLINEAAGVHVGYYYLKPLEGEKVDLTEYAKKEQLPTNYYMSMATQTGRLEMTKANGEVDTLDLYNELGIRKLVEQMPDKVDKADYSAAINELVKLATRERSWKKVRTIVIPSDEYKGQTIDGILYKNNITADGGIYRVIFETDEKGNALENYNITGAIVKVTPTTAININQGFITINNDVLGGQECSLEYFTGYKNTTAIKWFEVSLEPYRSSPLNDNPARYIMNGQINHKQINKFNFGGYEAKSVLGEGTKIEIWMYGYWD